MEGEEGDDDDEEAEDDEEKPLKPEVVREYISRARQHVPAVPPEVAPYIVEAYVTLRSQDQNILSDRTGGSGGPQNSDQTVMTARQLLSILRLSQALARLRFSDFVATEDVDEAIRLTHMSKATLLDDQTANSRGGGAEDVTSRIFGIIRDYNNSVKNRSAVELSVCEAMILRKGFTVDQLNTCLEEYESLNILQVNDGRTRVEFLMDN
jgi:DNA replication licensing factor MCM7